MKIDVFTIRDKSNNELIYAEGTNAYGEYCSFFEIDGKWLSDDEKETAGFDKMYDGTYTYSEEVRFLIGCDFEKITFNLEEVEIK